MERRGRILIPLPDRDFDVTEVATPWHRFKEHGLEVVFSTVRGSVAAADPLLIKGVLFGQLGAKPPALERYARMIQSPEFLHPSPYAEIVASQFDALVLPGGHAPGMKPYLESVELQAKVRNFFAQEKTIGAICHGVIVLARTHLPETGQSVIYDRQVTGLIKSLERTGYYLTFWKLGRYYRTYQAYVEDEIKANLADPSQFKHGQAPWIPSVIRDRNLVTARWPADAELFASTIIQLIEERQVQGKNSSPQPA